MNWYTMSDAAIGREVAARLKKERLARNMSQQALAQKTGIHRVTLSKIEGGQKMSLQTFIQLLRGLDLLERLNVMVPDYIQSPIELARSQGKERRRASAGRVEDKGEEYSW